MEQEYDRALVWFSCGAASAYAAKLATKKYPKERLEIIYCNTFAYEHPDNLRFFRDVERWVEHPIKILDPKEYTGFSDIWDVFDRTNFLNGPSGARCTLELKKKVRFKYQRPKDIHVFGYTVEERRRMERFNQSDPGLMTDWILNEAGITKRQCKQALQQAKIKLPKMYKLGYKNNNCIGCVKGKAGYWNKIRKDFPDVFNRMAWKERQLGFKLTRKWYLDEMPENVGRYSAEPEVECGVLCSVTLED